MARKIQVEIVGDSRSLGRAFQSAERRAVTFGGTMERSARRARIAFAAVGAGLVGGLIQGSRAFSQFEQSMSRIEGLAGGAQKDIARFRKEILKLGPEVGRGPKELGSALYFVASAGIKVKDQMEVVGDSARAAAAGLGETQTVADAVTSAMNAYGSSVLDARKATDVLVATVREGKGEAASFAPVIGNVAALAAKLGVSFSDVGAALAAQTRLGTDAETASTQLQALFSGLLKTAPKAEKEMNKFGLSSAGLRKELKERGLLAVLQRISVAFGDNDAAMAKAFPNIRALRGLLSLVGANANEVRGIFERLRNSTGSLTHAFAAAQRDEAFKWDQAKASIEGAFIRIGSFAAPAVKKLADGLNAGVTFFNDFIDKLSANRTITGKLSVVWTGINQIRQRAQGALSAAIAKIDWDAVWEKAKGIGDGLQARLERVDWRNVGRTIGDGIKDAVVRGLEGLKNIGERVKRALDTVDWVDVGRSLGPALAAAVVTGFLTLLDPAFWVRNWDLALSVAFVAAGGPIAKIAGKLVAPFARLGGRLAQAIGLGLIEKMPRLASLLIVQIPRAARYAFEKLGKLVSVELGFITDRISKWLAKHRVWGFLVKVTGVGIAINAVVDLVGRAKGVFQGLWDWMERKALETALKVIEPFSHIPSKGGAWARDLKSKWKAQLDEMAIKADSTAQRINRSLSKIEDRKVTINVQTVYTEGGDRNRPNMGRAPEATTGHPPPAGGKVDRKTKPAGETQSEAENRRLREELRRTKAQMAAQAKADKAAKDAKDKRAKTQKAELDTANEVKTAAEKAKEAWKAAGEKARQSFGELFQGPVLSGPIGEILQRYGAAIDPRFILRDLREQNQKTRSLLDDLDKAGRRGVPSGLLDSLRGMGLEGAGLVKSIANAPKSILNQIIAAYRQRQSMITAETVMIRADSVSLTTRGHPPAIGATLPPGVRRAEGGTVPGVGHGDRVPAMLTPGELVLNRRQQQGLSRVLGMPGATPDGLFGAIEGFATGGVAGAKKKRRQYTPREQLLRMLYMEGEWGGGTWVDRMNRWFPKAMGKVDSAAAWMTMAKPSDIAHAIRDPKWGWTTYMNYRRKASEQQHAVQDAMKEALDAGDRKTYEKLSHQLAAMTSTSVAVGSLGKIRTAVARGALEENAVGAAIHLRKNVGATFLKDLTPFKEEKGYIAAYGAYSEAIPAKVPLEKALLAYRKKYAHMLERDPALVIGAYKLGRGPLELELSRVFKSKAAAKKFAKQNRQWAIWDVKLGDEDLVLGKHVKGQPKPKPEDALAKQQELKARGGGIWIPEMADAGRLGNNGAALWKLLDASGPRRKMLYEFLTEDQQMAVKTAIIKSVRSAEEAKGFRPTDFAKKLNTSSLMKQFEAIGGEPAALKKPGAIRALADNFTTLLKLGMENAPQSLDWYRKTGVEARDFQRRAKAMGFVTAKGKPLSVRQAVDLLAVLSLKARPYDNYMNAVKALKQRMKGKPIRVSTGRVNDDVAKILDGVDPWGSDALKRPAYRDNILKYADRRAYDRMQKGSRLTVDRHVAAAAFGKNVPSDLEYQWMRGFFDVLERKTGISVENLQALMWVPQKAMNEYASRLARYGPEAASVKGKTWRDFIDEALQTYAKASTKVEGFKMGGAVLGTGNRDTVPAMLTPGEIVLNRRQQRGLSRVLGLGGSSPDRLFREISQYAGGGVIRRERTARSFLAGGASSSSDAGPTSVQHNTFQIPPHFADTQWAVERGLERANWRLRKGI